MRRVYAIDPGGYPFLSYVGLNFTKETVKNYKFYFSFFRRLSEEERDLDQARLAIEALRALLPVLEGSATEELIRDFKQVTANLQLAYADATKPDA